jgi:peptidoglycan/LPS O-acetylase OafA/YrhL
VELLTNPQRPAAPEIRAPAYHEWANLDFLRSIAVLMVFWAHWYDLQIRQVHQWTLIFMIAQTGLLMFFVHTCLVLMWSVERSGLSGWRSFVSFYIRRIFRIYPLSVLFILFAYYFDSRWDGGGLWPNLTLTQYIFFTERPFFPPMLRILWSLPLEVEMYLVIPLMVVLFRNRSLKTLLAVWCVSVVGALTQPNLGEAFYILRFVPCFLGGVVAWKVIQQRVKIHFPGWLWPAGIVAVSIIWVAGTEKYGALNIAFFGLALGFTIPLFLEIPWISIKRVAKILAEYSYGVYIAHFPIMLWVTRSSDQFPLFKKIPNIPHMKHYDRTVDLLLIIVLTASAAVLLYHLVERPCLILGKMLADWVTAPSKATPVPARAEEKPI